MKLIHSKAELQKLRDELGVRADWHEPDEQEVDAVVYGHSFDNAGFWGRPESQGLESEEMHVVISKDGHPVAAVNLATLLGWATGLEDYGQ